MTKQFSIFYKCRCMTEEQALTVRERRAGEDIVGFMTTVIQPALGSDHRRRSPLCTATKMEYLKMPVEDGASIGTTNTRH